jgi:hypothetical protein
VKKHGISKFFMARASTVFFLLANFKPTSSHFLLKAALEGHTKTEYSSENYCHQI